MITYEYCLFIQECELYEKLMSIIISGKLVAKSHGTREITRLQRLSRVKLHAYNKEENNNYKNKNK